MSLPPKNEHERSERAWTFVTVLAVALFVGYGLIFL